MVFGIDDAILSALQNALEASGVSAEATATIMDFVKNPLAAMGLADLPIIGEAIELNEAAHQLLIDILGIPDDLPWGRSDDFDDEESASTMSLDELSAAAQENDKDQQLQHGEPQAALASEDGLVQTTDPAADVESALSLNGKDFDDTLGQLEPVGEPSGERADPDTAAEVVETTETAADLADLNEASIDADAQQVGDPNHGGLGGDRLLGSEEGVDTFTDAGEIARDDVAEDVLDDRDDDETREAQKQVAEENNEHTGDDPQAMFAEDAAAAGPEVEISNQGTLDNTAPELNDTSPQTLGVGGDGVSDAQDDGEDAVKDDKNTTKDDTRDDPTDDEGDEVEAQRAEARDVHADDASDDLNEEVLTAKRADDGVETEPDDPLEESSHTRRDAAEGTPEEKAAKDKVDDPSESAKDDGREPDDPAAVRDDPRDRLGGETVRPGTTNWDDPLDLGPEVTSVADAVSTESPDAFTPIDWADPLNERGETPSGDADPERLDPVRDDLDGDDPLWESPTSPVVVEPVTTTGGDATPTATPRVTEPTRDDLAGDDVDLRDPREITREELTDTTRSLDGLEFRVNGIEQGLGVAQDRFDQARVELGSKRHATTEAQDRFAAAKERYVQVRDAGDTVEPTVRAEAVKEYRDAARGLKNAKADEAKAATALKGAEHELGDAIRARAGLSDDLDRVDARLEASAQRVDDAERMRATNPERSDQAEFAQDAAELRTDTETLKSRSGELRERVDGLEARTDEAKTRIDDLRTEVKDLHEARAAARDEFLREHGIGPDDVTDRGALRRLEDRLDLYDKVTDGVGNNTELGHDGKCMRLNEAKETWACCPECRMRNTEFRDDAVRVDSWLKSQPVGRNTDGTDAYINTRSKLAMNPDTVQNVGAALREGKDIALVPQLRVRTTRQDGRVSSASVRHSDECTTRGEIRDIRPEHGTRAGGDAVRDADRYEVCCEGCRVREAVDYAKDQGLDLRHDNFKSSDITHLNEAKDNGDYVRTEYAGKSMHDAKCVTTDTGSLCCPGCRSQTMPSDRFEAYRAIDDVIRSHPEWHVPKIDDRRMERLNDAAGGGWDIPAMRDTLETQKGAVWNRSFGEVLWEHEIKPQLGQLQVFRDPVGTIKRKMGFGVEHTTPSGTVLRGIPAMMMRRIDSTIGLTKPGLLRGWVELERDREQPATPAADDPTKDLGPDDRLEPVDAGLDDTSVDDLPVDAETPETVGGDDPGVSLLEAAIILDVLQGTDTETDDDHDDDTTGADASRLLADASARVVEGTDADIVDHDLVEDDPTVAAVDPLVEVVDQGQPHAGADNAGDDPGPAAMTLEAVMGAGGLGSDTWDDLDLDEETHDDLNATTDDEDAPVGFFGSFLDDLLGPSPE